MRFGLVASVFSGPRGSRLRAARFSLRARRRGVRARIPLAYRWEQALARPLSEVRAELRVAPVEQAHPAGILSGGMEAPWSFGPALC